MTKTYPFLVGARKGITSGGSFSYPAESAIEAARMAYKDGIFDNIPFTTDKDTLYICVTCFTEDLIGGWTFTVADLNSLE